MKKYWIFDNTRKLAESAEKIRSKVSNGQNIAVEKCNILTERLNNQISIIQDLNVKALESSTPLPKKIVRWWQWYHQLTGLDAVEAAKRQVIVLQDKLFKCQDNRRTLNNDMMNITNTLQEVYSELIQTKRDDPKYVQLTIIENKNLQEQKKAMNQLALLDKEEKDNFTQLATAIKEYHDNQNLNAQKYKYLSILASALVAIVSLIGSMVLSNRRIVDVRNIVDKAQEKNELLFNTNANKLSDVLKILHSLEIKYSQYLINSDKKKEKETDKEINHIPLQSNIWIASAKYTANMIISGASYVKTGIYACSSYIIKIFW